MNDSIFKCQILTYISIYEKLLHIKDFKWPKIRQIAIFKIFCKGQAFNFNP